MKITLAQVMGCIVLVVAGCILGVHIATYQWVGWGVQNKLLRFDPATKQFLPSHAQVDERRRPEPKEPEKKRPKVIPGTAKPAGAAQTDE